VRTVIVAARWTHPLTAAGLTLAVLFGAMAADAAATAWMSGARLQKRLQQPVDIMWSGNPLRRALGGLSAAQDVAVLLDRRIDPGQKVELSLNDVPLQVALERIAQCRKLGLSRLGGVFYFGPPEATARLRTAAALLHEAARKLPPETGRKFLLPKPLAWDDFATPGELLEQLAGEGGFEVLGAELVPHDLWAAADLPPLPMVDRLTLVLFQFDLTFQLSANGRQIKLVRLPKDVALIRSYPGGARPAIVARNFATLAPDAQIKVVGGKVYVKGLLEDHERITAPRRSPPESSTRPAVPVGRIRIERMSVKEKPIGLLLEQLAEQLNLELRIDRQGLQKAGVSLEQRVTVQVENVTVDELLQAVIQNSPLRFRRRGNVVEIGPLE